ncbi:ADP-ribosylation factor-like protein 13B [Lethenteron reissneri]|uniref:ADP-ribosylation factor-like protein 13B n=1 Tax=Lethenteron reissneri TaxID=7753 RepID=UPI002AB7A77A|nr:ADP-ribosylation factor-like protein 13B [Lethenteron reissneri]
MFSVFANCCSWVKWKRKPMRDVTLVMLGLDNAGKTAAVKGLQGEDLKDITPTVGFSKAEMRFGRFDVTVFDLGGGKPIRGIWHNYLAEAHGVVFAVDSSDAERLQEAHETLSAVLVDPRVAGKPLLVLANKQDKVGALGAAEVIEHLSLEQLVNENKCICHIETCSAVVGSGKKQDRAIVTGLHWILRTINHDYAELKERVERDTAAQRAQEAAQRKERRERVLRVRQERDQQEREEAERQGKSVMGDEGNEVMENPFQPIENVIAQNEDRMKREKDTAKRSASALNGEVVLQEKETSAAGNAEPGLGERGPPALGDSADEAGRPASGSARFQHSEGDTDRTDTTSAGVDEKPKKKRKKVKRNKVEPANLDDHTEGGTTAFTATTTSSDVRGRPLPPLVLRPIPNSESNDILN